MLVVCVEFDATPFAGSELVLLGSVLPVGADAVSFDCATVVVCDPFDAIAFAGNGLVLFPSMVIVDSDGGPFDCATTLVVCFGFDASAFAASAGAGVSAAGVPATPIGTPIGFSARTIWRWWRYPGTTKAARVATVRKSAASASGFIDIRREPGMWPGRRENGRTPNLWDTTSRRST